MFSFFQKSFGTKKPYVTQKKETYDCIAPDKSEIRLLTTSEHAKGGSMCHCTVKPCEVTDAIKHKTVEELWYVLNGEGAIWLNKDGCEEIIELKKGVALSIPPDTKFQFRNNSATENLEIVITTMPSWPGADEALFVKGIWNNDHIPTLTRH